jgi:hypothetical protein
MPGNPFTDPNWAAELADTVERVVGSVRDKTTRPIVKASRAIVFGLIAAMVGVVVVTLAVIGAMRAVEALLDLWLTHARAVYVSYFVIGGILCLAGALFMRRRSPT